MFSKGMIYYRIKMSFFLGYCKFKRFLFLISRMEKCMVILGLLAYKGAIHSTILKAQPFLKVSCEFLRFLSYKTKA